MHMRNAVHGKCTRSVVPVLTPLRRHPLTSTSRVVLHACGVHKCAGLAATSPPAAAATIPTVIALPKAAPASRRAPSPFTFLFSSRLHHAWWHDTTLIVMHRTTACNNRSHPGGSLTGNAQGILQEGSTCVKDTSREKGKVQYQAVSAQEKVGKRIGESACPRSAQCARVLRPACHGGRRATHKLNRSDDAVDRGGTPPDNVTQHRAATAGA